MKDNIDLGSSPCDEDCAQLGTPGYDTKAREECKNYIALLRRKFGEEPVGAHFRIKSNPHDFGNYYSVIIEFNDENQEAADYAYFVEGNLPATWSDDAPLKQEGRSVESIF